MPRNSGIGIKPADALHVAAAEELNADVFLTCDDRLLRAARRNRKKLNVNVANPLGWLQELENDQNVDEIRRAGLDALRERLGPVDMIRFLQQFETGHGDYAREHHDRVDRTTLDDIRKTAGLPAKTARKPRKRKGA